MSFTVEPEPGRAAFFTVLTEHPATFKAKEKEIFTKWKSGRESKADAELAQELISIFTLMCQGREAALTQFLNDQVQVKLTTKHKEAYLQQKSRASAVVQILSEASRGEIPRPQSQLDQIKRLAAIGQERFQTLQNTPSMRETLQKASTSALVALQEANALEKKDIDAKLDIVEEKRRRTVNALTNFIHTLFPKPEDRDAVEAFACQKFFNNYCFSKEFYIHYSSNYDVAKKEIEAFIRQAAIHNSPGFVLSLPTDPELGRRLFNALVTLPYPDFKTRLTDKIVPLFEEAGAKKTLEDDELYQTLLTILIEVICKTDEEKKALSDFLIQGAKPVPVDEYKRSVSLISSLYKARQEGTITRTKQEKEAIKILARVGERLCVEAADSKKRTKDFDHAFDVLLAALRQKFEYCALDHKRWDAITHQWIDLKDGERLPRPPYDEARFAEKDQTIQALRAFVTQVFPQDEAAVHAFLDVELFSRYGYSQELYRDSGEVGRTPFIAHFFEDRFSKKAAP